MSVAEVSVCLWLSGARADGFWCLVEERISGVGLGSKEERSRCLFHGEEGEDRGVGFLILGRSEGERTRLVVLGRGVQAGGVGVKGDECDGFGL